MHSPQSGARMVLLQSMSYSSYLLLGLVHETLAMEYPTNPGLESSVYEMLMEFVDTWSG
jgi:hypothetical protein